LPHYSSVAGVLGL